MLTTDLLSLISSNCFQDGMLLHQLVPIQTWDWEIHASKCGSLPVHPSDLCFLHHQQQKRVGYLWMEWWDLVQDFQWPEEQVRTCLFTVWNLLCVYMTNWNVKFIYIYRLCVTNQPTNSFNSNILLHANHIKPHLCFKETPVWRPYWLLEDGTLAQLSEYWRSLSW